MRKRILSRTKSWPISLITYLNVFSRIPVKRFEEFSLQLNGVATFAGLAETCSPLRQLAVVVAIHSEFWPPSIFPTIRSAPHVIPSNKVEKPIKYESNICLYFR